MKVFVYDLETTGRHYLLHGIHQLSGAIIDLNTGKALDDVDLKICPHGDCEYEKGALEASGTTLRKVMKYPDEQTAYDRLTKGLRKWKGENEKYILMGYFNAHFDNDFLNEFFKRNAIGKKNLFPHFFYSGSLDVSVIAMEFLREQRHELENFKLHTVAEYLGIKVDATKLHQAYYDVQLTWQIYKKVSRWYVQ